MIKSIYILGILLLRTVEGANKYNQTTCDTVRNQSSNIQLSSDSGKLDDLDISPNKQKENQLVDGIINHGVQLEDFSKQNLETTIADNNSISDFYEKSKIIPISSRLTSASTRTGMQVNHPKSNTQMAVGQQPIITSSVILKKNDQQALRTEFEITSLLTSDNLVVLSFSDYLNNINSLQTNACVEAKHNLESTSHLSDLLAFDNLNGAKSSSDNLSIDILEDEQLNRVISENQEDDDAISDLLTFEEWVQRNVHNSNDNNKDIHKQRSFQKSSENDQIELESSNYLFGEENEVDFGIFSDSSSINDDDGNPFMSGKYQKRFNFASADCAATVIKTNKEAKGASALLIENKESYMLNECHVEESYVIIELCEDILIDTVSVGNYEYFSSTFKDLEIFASDRYPIPYDDWESLGSYEAKNIREIQLFSIKNPAIWARYLRIEFRSHYGNKFYCPVSSIKVHGRTMMDEYKIEESKKIKSDSIDSDIISQRENLDPTRVIHRDKSGDFLKRNEGSEQKKNNENYKLNSTNNMNAEICSDNKRRAYGFDEFLDDLKRDESCESVTFLNESKYPMDEMKVRILAGNDTLKAASSNKRVSDINNNGGQESIYKNIMNRLSMLELNSTLSMLYFAEQSKVLGESFLKLERKQKKKFNLLVMALNDTYQLQMEEFKKSFSLIRKESELLIESQSELNEAINDKIDHNFKLLSDELSFQKKLLFIFFMMFICLLMFVLLSKDRLIEGEFLEELLEEPTPNRIPVLSNSSEESSLLEYTGQESQLPLKKKWKLKIGSSLGLMAKSPLSPNFRMFKEQSNFKHAKSYSTGNIEEDIKEESSENISLTSAIKNTNSMITPEASDSES